MTYIPAMADETGRGGTNIPSGSGAPTDLVAVIVLAVLALWFVYLPGLWENPLRLVFGLLLVVFLPGYAVVAAVFPMGKDPDGDCLDTRRDELSGELTSSLPTPNENVDGLERVVLSIGMSCITVVLTGLLLNYTRWSIRPIPLAVVLIVITIVMTIVAAIQRWRLPRQVRFQPPFRSWLSSAYSEFTERDSRIETVLNVVIVIAVLVTASSFVYAVTVPHDGERFTELSLLTKDDGDLVADNYPQRFVSGETRSMVVGLSNHERETVEYSIVVELQQIETRGGDSEVVEQIELGRFNATLSHGQTKYFTYEVTPNMTGDRQRLAFMLYRDDPPARPSLNNAYRSSYLWIDVVDDRPVTNETSSR